MTRADECRSIRENANVFPSPINKSPPAVVKVQGEIEIIQPKVEKIVDEVTDAVGKDERVRESLANPMQSIGSAFGKELDAKLQSFMESKLGQQRINVLAATNLDACECCR